MDNNTSAYKNRLFERKNIIALLSSNYPTASLISHRPRKPWRNNVMSLTCSGCLRTQRRLLRILAMPTLCGYNRVSIMKKGANRLFLLVCQSSIMDSSASPIKRLGISLCQSIIMVFSSSWAVVVTSSFRRIRSTQL